MTADTPRRVLSGHPSLRNPHRESSPAARLCPLPLPVRSLKPKPTGPTGRTGRSRPSPRRPPSHLPHCHDSACPAAASPAPAPAPIPINKEPGGGRVRCPPPFRPRVPLRRCWGSLGSSSTSSFQVRSQINGPTPVLNSRLSTPAAVWPSRRPQSSLLSRRPTSSIDA